MENESNEDAAYRELFKETGISCKDIELVILWILNYYDKNNSKKILFELKKCIDKKYLKLIEWLENATKNYNGFYILGI